MFSGLLVTVSGVTAGSAAQTDYGLGGGNTLPPNPAVTLAQGLSATNFTRETIQNTGAQTAQVAFSVNGAPSGVSVTASESAFSLQPKEVKEVDLSVSVGSAVAPGTYKVIAQFTQTNVPTQSGSVVYVPAVSANFTLKVDGQVGSVNLQAVAEGSDAPVSGQLSVLASAANNRGIPLVSANSSSLNAKLAPGTYEARFQIPNLVSKSQQFQVIADQTTNVTISVKTVSFFQTAAKPVPASGQPATVNLLATIRNDISDIAGPVVVQVQVTHDGDNVAQVELQRFDSLKSGLTDVKQVWAPDDGFQPGTYQFVFQVVTPQFTISADNPPTLTISWWTPLKIAVIVGLIIVIILVIMIILIRRRRSNATTSAPLVE